MSDLSSFINISANTVNSGNDITTQSNVSATGNVTASNFVGNVVGNVTGNLVSGGNYAGFDRFGDFILPDSVYIGVGNSMGLVITTCSTGATIAAPQTGQNLIFQTNSVGPVYHNLVFDEFGNLTVPGNIIGTNNISAAGNIAATNFITAGTQGNIYGANVISGVTLTATGNVYGSVFGVNCITGGLLTAGLHGCGSYAALVSNVAQTCSPGFYATCGACGVYVWGALTSNVIVGSNNHLWEFDTIGNLTAPGNILTSGNINAGNLLVLQSIGPANPLASPAPSLNGFDSINSLNVSAAGNVYGNFVQAATLRTTASSIALGGHAGNVGQGTNAVAIGLGAGNICQSYNTVAIGVCSGAISQGGCAVAIGLNAGQISQGGCTVAVGWNAGQISQGLFAVAVGPLAGQCKQGVCAVAVGSEAGKINQGANAVAVGWAAGVCHQGHCSIAIGTFAGVCHQANNTIILNATGSPLNGVSAQTCSLYVAPIRGCVAGANVLYYDTTTKEVTYGLAGSSYGNANVATYLSSGNINTNILTTGNISASGNVNGSNAIFNGSLIVTGNANVQGTLTYNNITNLTTSNLVLGLGNNQSGINVTGGGMEVGNTGEASFFYNYTNRAWYSNIGISAIGNISGNYFIGNGSQLTGVTSTPVFGSTIAIGTGTGNAQGTYAVAVGLNAGNITQGTNSVALGRNAGQSHQGSCSVAIGPNAGQKSQGGIISPSSSVAIGVNAGQSCQGALTVAIGSAAGGVRQGNAAVAIGQGAGKCNQGFNSISIGNAAGNCRQGPDSIAIGVAAAQSHQGTAAVAIGGCAGRLNQGNTAIAIGCSAGRSNQGINAIAMGTCAGRASQAANSIIINAAGTPLNSSHSGFYVAPVRCSTTAGGSPQIMGYCNTSKEIVYGLVGSSYGNANVTALLSSGNINTNILTTANVSATGNVTGNYLLGNVACASGLPAGYSNANVTTLLSSGTVSTDILTTANVSGVNILSGGSISAIGNTNTLSLITRNGNPNPVNANPQITLGYNGTTDYPQFIHTKHNGGSSLYNTIEMWTSDGTQAGTFPANAILGLTVTNGNIATGGILTNNYYYANGTPVSFGGGTYGNSNVSAYLSSGTVSTNILTTANVSATGNIITSGTVTGNHVTQINGNIAFGPGAGQTSQGTNTVAIGVCAGSITQGNSAVAIGQNAGAGSQGICAVAIGHSAGSSNQGGGAVAMGQQAGAYYQTNCAVAIGAAAGQTSQGGCSVAIGVAAGQCRLGQYSIAIGAFAGPSYGTCSVLPASSIVINASGSGLPSYVNGRQGVYILPVQSTCAGGGNLSFVLNHCSTTGLTTYGSANNVVGSALGGGGISSNVSITGTTVTTGISTLASLGPPVIPGTRAFINDSSVPAAGNFGTSASTGGSNIVPVFSDGIGWYIG